jgi:DNA uptake protein ComE-like DNA-binding protein
MVSRWRRFRGLPAAAQAVLWVAAFPLVVLLALTRGRSRPRWRLAAGAAVCAFTAPVWVALYLAPFTSPPDGPAIPPAEAGAHTPQDEADAGQPVADPDPADETGELASGPAVPEPDLPSGPTPAVPTAPVPGSPQPDLPSARAPPEAPDPGTATSTLPATGPAGDGVLVATLLAELTVAAEHPDGYDRALFPHWVTTGGCSTRSHVLIRDSGGTATVETGCRVVAGSWYSPFDDMWVTSPGALDIDHLVPLAEAWRSGARHWDADTRRRFANDLTDPRTLIAVTAAANRSKADKDPADWLPPHRAYRCAYVGSWVAVKHVWELAVDVREKEAITAVLAGCGELRTDATAPARPATGPPTPPAEPSPSQSPSPQPDPVTCVNINTASAEDLSRIVHIGPARAQDLTAKRPFVTVDDLVRVDGIGPARLQLSACAGPHTAGRCTCGDGVSAAMSTTAHWICSGLTSADSTISRRPSTFRSRCRCQWPASSSGTRPCSATRRIRFRTSSPGPKSAWPTTPWELGRSWQIISSTAPPAASMLAHARLASSSVMRSCGHQPSPGPRHGPHRPPGPSMDAAPDRHMMRVWWMVWTWPRRATAMCGRSGAQPSPDVASAASIWS